MRLLTKMWDKLTIKATKMFCKGTQTKTKYDPIHYTIKTRYTSLSILDPLNLRNSIFHH
jgi:hypothetical protein